MNRAAQTVQTLRLALPTGELALTIRASQFPLEDVLGFAARANTKRGFLFLSKVLGKHWPVTPAMMERIHVSLAQGVPDIDGPVVFIAMAETAIGLGQGVFEAWLRQHPGDSIRLLREYTGREALFLHTSRYRVGDAPIIEFEEAHSHAPRQFLHLPPDPHTRALLMNAKALVLVDDEASTGNTFLNLSNACRKLNPGIEQVHLATITNFMGEQAGKDLTQRFGVPVTLGSPICGEYQFVPGKLADDGAPAQRFDASADRGASAAFGRYGLHGPLSVAPGLAERIGAGIGKKETVLVLGTGEFMHAAYLLGAALERMGAKVLVQSTTRSPILTWGAVTSSLTFPDNYGEGIANFLYNVTPGHYDHVLICHETAPNAALMGLARTLKARLFHFITETQVEEIPVR